MALGIVKGFLQEESVPPVGFVWKSNSSVSPASMFANTTWSQIKDRAIIAAGGSYGNGLTGGRSSVTLLVNNLPSHTHSGSTSSAGGHTHTATVSSSHGYMGTMGGVHGFSVTTVTTSSAGGHSHSVSLSNAGSGGSFSILNPYIVRYMWERIG